MRFNWTGQVMREAEGASGGGAPDPGAGGAPPAPAHPVAAPWEGAEGVWKIGEGDSAQPWYAAIPEPEARAHVEAKQYATPAELALANYNLTKMQRGADDVVAIPAKDADQSTIDQFYRKLGVPESPQGYELQFGEGVQVDDKMVEFGKNTFHKANLTPQQAQIVSDEWNKMVAEQGAAFAEEDRQQNEQALDELKSRWGAELDRNKAAGQRVVQSLGLSTDLVQRVEGAMGSAAVVELLATIGRKSDEGGFTGGSNTDPNDPSTMSAQQAQEKITQLRSDPEFEKRYTDKNHPAHQEAVKQIERLFART